MLAGACLPPKTRKIKTNRPAAIAITMIGTKTGKILAKIIIAAKLTLMPVAIGKLIYSNLFITTQLL